MKKLSILFSLFLLVGLASANTTVNATITDSTGQIFALGTYQVDYIRPASNQGTIPTVNGVPIQEHGITGQINSAGTFSVSLTDVLQIVPSGGQWEFTICPNASAQCSIIDTQSLVTGASVDLSTFLSARVIAPVVSPSNINRAYKDSEVISTTGTFYYDVILNCIKFNNGSGWACVGSGGGGGTPGSPINSLQWNNAGVFTGTTDANGLAATTYAISNGQINPCNIDNVRYASCYNWSQVNSATLTGGTPATITLAPGPRGVDTSNNATFSYYMYISGVGTPEAVKITGGSCTTQGSSSCTVTFTPANSHSTGFTIQSATAGHAEAAMDAIGINNGPARIYTRPAGGPATPSSTGNNQFNSIFYAPWFVRCSYCILDGDGGTWALNNLRAVVVLNSRVTVENVRFMPMITTTHAAITQTSCSANVATITTTLNPKVGEMVDVQFTNNPGYWGPHIVLSSSASSWTFTKTCTSIASEITAGGNDYQMAMIEDNQGSAVRISHVGMSFGGAPYDKLFNNGIVIINDQSGMEIDNFLTEGHGSCNALYCGSAVYAPGDFVTGPAVVNITNSGLSVGCSLNGVTAYNGNTVAIDNTIIQAYAMWAVNGGTQRGGFGGIKMTNNYNEIGSCTNPMYTPDQAAGVIWSGNTVTELGGEVSQGQLATFCTGGATSYYYYVVVHDGASGTQSAPLFIGAGAPSGANCTVRWSRAQDTVIGGFNQTYDILRSTDIANAPTTATCAGGSTTACGSVTLAQAQCSGTLQCQFIDDVTVNTTAYTVLMPDLTGSGIAGATYSPTFLFFAGNFVLQGAATLNIQGSNVGNSSIATNGVMATNGVGPIITDGFATSVPRTYVRVHNLRGNLVGTTMTRIYDPSNPGGAAANSMGKLAFINPAKGLGGHTYGTGSYLITLATPKSDEVIAAGNPRTLTADLNDSGIGLDMIGSSNPALYSTGYSSPVAHSFYIGSFLDGLSWKWRTNANQTEFAQPTQFDFPMLSLLGCTDCGPFNRTTPFTNDLLQTPPNLSGNWTVLLGTWVIGSGTAFPSGNYAYASALVSEGGINRAYAAYTGSAFSNDQIVQANITPINSIIGICVRMANATPLTAYCFSSGGGNKLLTKYVAGAPSNLASGGPQFPNNAIIKLTVIGTTIKAYINGTLTYSVTDSAITSGAPGLYVQNLATSNQGIRNFYATSAGFTDLEDLTMANITAQSGKFLGPTQITTGTASNTDLAGTLTFTAATTSTTYTFTGTYTNHPVCTLTPEFDIGANRLWWSTISTTTLQATSNANQTGTIDYLCIGRN